MDTDSSLLFVLLIALIIGGGYFAASETAFASVNPMRIRHRAENGERRAKRAEYILEHFNKALSTLLIGNNIMHIGTASLSTYLVTKLWGEGYTGISTIVTTVVVFFVSEMIPKQYAKDRPESAALFFAPSMVFLMKVMTPVSAFFDGLANLVSHLFKVKEVPTVTEDELMEMIDSLADTEEDGQQRSELLHSALEFDSTLVRDIMIPTESVVGIVAGMKTEEVLNVIRQEKYSRLPVWSKARGTYIGVLDVRSYIKSYLADPEHASVRKVISKTMTVSETRHIDELFDELTQSRTHMCFAADESGKIVGIVTMEDILEELVGEIWDEGDDVREGKEEE